MQAAIRFLYLAWSIGYCMTSLGLTAVTLADAFRIYRARMRAEEVEVPNFLHDWSRDLIRAALWPFYLARPW